MHVFNIDDFEELLDEEIELCLDESDESSHIDRKEIEKQLDEVFKGRRDASLNLKFNLIHIFPQDGQKFEKEECPLSIIVSFSFRTECVE